MFRHFFDKVNLLFFKFASILTLTLVLLTTMQVICRYMFNLNSIGLQELQWHIFSAVFLLSIPYLLKQNEHVKIDVISQYFSDKISSIINIIFYLIFLWPTCFILVYFGVTFLLESLDYTNPRPANYYCNSFLTKDSILYYLCTPLEKILREYILIGEISPNPGGLEARWILKILIPLCGLMLFIQSLFSMKNEFLRFSIKNTEKT